MYEEGGKLGYWARYFYQLFKPHSDQYIGGVAAVRKMLEAGGAASGLATVLSLERSDLAVETLVLREKWDRLFKPWDRRQAKENLRLANALLKQALHRLQIDKDHLVDELGKIPSGSDGIRDNRLRKLSGRYRQLAACEDEIPYSLQRFGMQDRMTFHDFIWKPVG